MSLICFNGLIWHFLKQQLYIPTCLFLFKKQMIQTGLLLHWCFMYTYYHVNIYSLVDRPLFLLSNCGKVLHISRLHLLPAMTWYTVYPKKYAHGFCFAVLCCGYTLTDFPISIRLTSLALWQSNDCPSASKAALINMDKYFMWIHYERLHNHSKAKHNKTVCIILGIYCSHIFKVVENLKYSYFKDLILSLQWNIRQIWSFHKIWIPFGIQK